MTERRFIYIARSRELKMYKIGLSKNLQKRLIGLNNDRGKTRDWKMLDHFPGTLVEELTLHRSLRHRRDRTHLLSREYYVTCHEVRSAFRRAKERAL